MSIHERYNYILSKLDNEIRTINLKYVLNTHIVRERKKKEKKREWSANYSSHLIWRVSDIQYPVF